MVRTCFKTPKQKRFFTTKSCGFLFFPEFPEAVGGEFGFAVPGEDPLVVHPVGPMGSLGGPEVAEVPDMRACYERFLSNNLKILFDHFGLVFLAEHRRR